MIKVIKLKMFSRLVMSLSFQFVVFGSSSNDFSYFKSTKVLTDSCSPLAAYSVFVSKKALFCAVRCSENVNCRRFMIRNQPNGVECSLYYEGENCATLQPTGCSCYRKAFSLLNNSAICPLGLYGDYCENTIRDCSEGNDRGLGVFDKWVRSYIKPLGMSKAFEVMCELQYGGFTIIMSRNNVCQEISFKKNITEYVDGFGDAIGDHWLGLTRIKVILDNHPRNKLSVVLFEQTYCENSYSNFSLGTKANGYPIIIGDYENWPTNKCGDSLTGAVNIEGSPFSAPGSDQTSFNCADNRQGGWWYANDSRCSESYLMGSRDAMLWPTSLGSSPLHFAALRIKPYHK